MKNKAQQKAAQHTPGPLAWQKFGDEWCLTGQYGMRPIVLSVGKLDGKVRRLQLLDNDSGLLIPFDPKHPDALLIAAAPELHALVFEKAGADCLCQDHGTCWHCRARAAIAKAGGAA